MENLILDLLEYLKTRKIDVVIENKEYINEKTFITIVTEILGWLRLEYKRSLWQKQGKSVKHKPLLLNYNFIWCQNLREIMSYPNRISDFFVINDNSFNFNHSITEEKQEIIRKLVYEKYVPFVIK